MNNATTRQPLPTQPAPDAISINQFMKVQYGSLMVIHDIQLRAEEAQQKYQLERMGLFPFNGRDALLDAYQEICDLIVYLVQSRYEDMVRVTRGEIKEPRISDQFICRKLDEAAYIRDFLVRQGDFS